MAPAAQIFTYTVSNGLATINGELLVAPSEAIYSKFTKVTELGKLPLKGTNDKVELFELQQLDPRKNLIVSDFVEYLQWANVTNYTVANGRVYGGENIGINPYLVTNAIEVLGVTVDEEKLFEVKVITDDTIAIVTQTDWQVIISSLA